MVDQISLERIKLLHPARREEASSILYEAQAELGTSATLRFSHTLRTFKEQDMLYSIGRTTQGKIVTNSRGGYSYHNYGLAIDICLIKDGKATWDVKSDWDKDGKSDWLEVVNVFKRYGWDWGGDWRFYDPPHFQKTSGMSINSLLALKKAGAVDKDGFVLF